MPQTIKQSALDIAAALARVEETAALASEAHAAALEELHSQLRGSLYYHRIQLGLSDADVSEIDNHGAQLRGGTPKGPPEEP